MDNEKEITENKVEDNSQSVEKKSSDNSSKFIKEVLSWIKTIIMALILAYFITNFLIVNAVVPSGSMETTVMTNDRLVANRLSYLFSDPERYDIVVFQFPDDESTLYIKRIIGMPGETIEIRDGNVYVQGQEEPLRSDFVNGYMFTEDPSTYPMVVTIPKKGDNIADFDGIEDPEIYDEDGDGKFDADCFFMLGDNRNHSADARSWHNQYLSQNKMEGKAVFRYWPLTEMGLIK